MLRPYKPIGNEIFTLHKMISHLVCNVWCQADGTNYLDKIVSGKKKRYKYTFKQIVLAYDWLNVGVKSIYLKFANDVNDDERALIKKAFKINNRIEDLCNGTLNPIRIDDLPQIVADDIYPLFKRLYKELLDRKKVKGDKLTYYSLLIAENDFRFCPCCGYMAFDSSQLESREAFDHYLPISEYPFAGINFKNLVPLCHKCNSSEKHSVDTLKNGRKAFYPFRKNEIKIEIKFVLNRNFKKAISAFIINEGKNKEDKKKVLNTQLIIDLSSSIEQEQVETWNALFNIKNRLIDRAVGFSFEVLEDIREHYLDEKGAKTHLQIIESKLKEYKRNSFSDEKYLKGPFLEAVKGWSALIRYWNLKVQKSSDFKDWVSSS